MTGQTPIYGLPYLTGSDGGRHVPQVSRDLALQLEAILAHTGQIPLDSDLQSLLGRLGELETRLDAALSPANGTVPTWLNGFRAYAVPPWNGVRYWLRGGVVTITGAAIKNESWGVEAAICQLPPGHRPAIRVQGEACYVDTDGTVRAGTAPGRAISFSATFVPAPA